MDMLWNIFVTAIVTIFAIIAIAYLFGSIGLYRYLKNEEKNSKDRFMYFVFYILIAMMDIIIIFLLTQTPQMWMKAIGG